MLKALETMWSTWEVMVGDCYLVTRLLLTLAEKNSDGGVTRSLKERHLSMIALGGAIGTGELLRSVDKVRLADDIGLFVGSGAALSTGGPVGAWLAYIIMAIMVYSMMIALGEMGSLIPTSGAFTHYCARFVDPALGFATGINYWCECRESDNASLSDQSR
jgi:amino acid transporter